jgi:predicted nuclease of predicted toxin-antitoxin system
VRFLVDGQLPPAMARMLVSLGHEAQHVADLNFRSATDSMIWDFALEHRAVLLTKDEDFPHRLHQSAHAPVVVWLRVGNVSRRGILSWFSPLLPQIGKLAEEGHRLIELR